MTSNQWVGWGLTVFIGGLTCIATLVAGAEHPARPLVASSVAVCLFGLGMAARGARMRSPQPNISIARAVDYLVNYSTAVLESNPPPHLETFGPAKGRLVCEVGRPQADALRKIEEQLGFGTLCAFGRRALDASLDDPSNFDSVLKIIPREYWDGGTLHPLFAPIHESAHAQTAVRSGSGGHALYARVMLDRTQLHRVWPRKPIWRRFWERVKRRKPRTRE